MTFTKPELMTLHHVLSFYLRHLLKDPGMVGEDKDKMEQRVKDLITRTRDELRVP